MITDGASPVGRAIALQLALQGSYVIVAFRQSTEEIKRTMQELQSLGTLANAVETDISAPEGAKKLVAEVDKMFGRLDLLVNCLKFEPQLSFDKTDENLFEKAFGINLKAPFWVTQEAMRLMKWRPKPKIVNVISALDTAETADNVLYAMSQMAVRGFTQSLAGSLPKNFRVNAVAVSEKKTADESADTELFRAKNGVSEDDVARAVLFLLSSEAIGINGQVIIVE